MDRDAPNALGAPEVAGSSVEFESHLTISFDNDVVWEFDIPKVDKKTAEQVVRELGGAT